MNPRPIIPTVAKLGFWTGLILSPALAVLAVPVTFRVNMEIQSELGVFNATAGHAVELHGSFDGWGAGAVLAPSAADENIYEAIVDLAGNVGSEVQYKFVINQSGTQVWENNGVGPNGAANRAVNIP